MKRLLKFAFGAAVLACLALAGAAYALQDRLLYFPNIQLRGEGVLAQHLPR